MSETLETIGERYERILHDLAEAGQIMAPVVERHLGAPLPTFTQPPVEAEVLMRILRPGDATAYRNSALVGWPPARV